MQNINLHEGVVAWGMLYLGMLAGGLLVFGLMSFCVLRKKGGGR